VAALFPEHLEQTQRMLCIPLKRADTQPVDYLELGYPFNRSKVFASTAGPLRGVPG